MHIPQLTGTKRSIAIILLMVPIGGLSNAFLSGEVHEMHDVWKAILHGIIPAIGIAAGWVFLRSPWGSEFQSMMHQEGSKTTTLPSGAKVEEKTETTVTTSKVAPKI